PAAYLSLFRKDPIFIENGIPVLRVIASAMILLSAGTIWLNAVTGTGNSRVTFIIEILTLAFYCIYIFWVLEMRKMGILWGWMSEILYWTILFALSFFYMKSRRWQKTII
ncbi:MAG TPA: hypothetical protein VFR58_15540, partial [Flavisolibacter sp.]|nr:hypothetical protein [Flavisolibacter sp.]